MSKTIGVMLGLLNLITSSFLVDQLDEKVIWILLYLGSLLGNPSKDPILSSPTWIITLKSSASFRKSRMEWSHSEKIK